MTVPEQWTGAAARLEGHAISGAPKAWTATELAERVAHLASALARAQPRPRVLGVLADNGPDWVVVDLAAERAEVTLVPLPGFFTDAQLRHAVAATGMDALFCAAPSVAATLGFGECEPVAPTGLRWFRRDAAAITPPAGTAKITFTSGTTGTPKGVCVSSAQQRAVALALVQATRHLGIDRHLALLPLPVLLENIAGVYAPLLAGATCCVPPLADVGMAGVNAFDPCACLDAIERWQAQSVILLPQMLLALTAAIEGGAARPSTLRFAAVGGAKVAPALIERARAAGIPAYEGYGLSECASVVALNVPGTDKPGSVGRALPHVDVRIGSGSEILVRGSGFLGYLGDERPQDEWLPTGDLGRIDPDGFIHVHGRRKHVLITSFGRNVAPEWPEAELTAQPGIAQAAVFGDAQPRLSAVIVPASDAAGDEVIDHAVRAANRQLPGYAQIAHWVRARAPFSAADGLATPNGRPMRTAIWDRYGARLESLY